MQHTYVQRTSNVHSTLFTAIELIYLSLAVVGFN